MLIFFPKYEVLKLRKQIISLKIKSDIYSCRCKYRKITLNQNFFCHKNHLLKPPDLLCLQACLLRPLPPNLIISLQAVHLPQSGDWQT